jgi:ribonuclease HI
MPQDPDALIVAYTDGACSGNPGPGGWAWAVESGPSASGGESASTNQRMEVQAVLEALRALLPVSGGGVGRVRIVSDSTYVVNCFKARWYVNWERNGWRNSQKQPVANQDLWKPLIALAKADLHRIEFVWVKGHSGNTMNDLVDRLAVAAAKDAALGITSSSGSDTASPEAEAPPTSQASLF